MRHGPCGGVRADLSCEMAPVPCPFATLERAVPWTGPAAAGGDPNWPPRRRPLVVTDLSITPFSAASVRSVVSTLAGSCDGMLVAEHHDRPGFPPTVMTGLVREAGGNPWITLTCRDRNRVVLEQELAGLAHAGAAAVLTVTGDGRAQGVRPDVTQVFDIDSTTLAALAAVAGLNVVVAESPAAPPFAVRPLRLREKERAGARLCLLNAAGSTTRVAEFAAAARAAGVGVGLVAGVAVYTDQRGAAGLRLPGLELDQDEVASVLSAPDPVEAGIEAAVARARALLAVDGVIGVNLSGRGSYSGEIAAAEIKAEIGRRIQASA
jgi:methylenetetrahydrofolate reductase (NADPH)